MYGNNKRLMLNVLWIVLGAALLGLSAAGKLDSELYSGMGGALMGIGFLQLIRTLRYRTDADYQAKMDVVVSDERNQFLKMKSWAWTGYIVVMTSAAGSVIALVLGKHQLQMTLSSFVCALLVVYWIVYLVLSRKY